MQQKAHARTILFLSNGYGEDTVGARIAQSVQALAGSRLRPVAFPIVGAGDPYRLVGIPVIGPRAPLPSGGFGYLNIRNAVKDVLAGSVGMALRQLQFAWRHRDEWNAVVGVGDSPMRDGLDPNPAVRRKVEVALQASGWDGSSPVVALLPGSRKDA